MNVYAFLSNVKKMILIITHLKNVDVDCMRELLLR